MEVSDCLLKNFNQWESGFLSYYSEQNGSREVKANEKLCTNLVAGVVCIFVSCHLDIWKDMEGNGFKKI